MKTWKSYLIWTILFIVGFAAVSFLPALKQYDYRTLNFFQTEHAAHPDVVILAIDNKSLQDIGRWPWDRQVHAEVIDLLNAAGVRAIGIDVNFSEPQTGTSDDVLALSLQRSRIPVILPAEPVYLKGQSEPNSFLTPLSEFLTGSVKLGHSHVEPGLDGGASSMPGVISGGTYEPFSAVLAKAVHAQPELSQNALISFAGPAGSVQTYSFIDVLNGRVGAEALRDKIVLIGATASDLHDLIEQTPVGLLAGVEWHANVLSNYLNQGYIRVVPEIYQLIFRLLLALLFLAAMMKLRNRAMIISFTAVIVLLFVLSLLLWQMRWALPVVMTSVFLLLVFVSRASYRWYMTEREKRRLRQNFKNYFSPQVLEMVLEHPDALKLGGQRRETTILFSDIRSFTTITESLDPETLSVMLAEYFTEMTKEVLDTDGVLDKFIGDAVMAFWGAPIAQPDQADRAVKAALGMLERLKKLQVKWREKGLPDLDIGIGINSGEVIVGNMGSEDRFDYTVIGDAVNAASRLESLNKEFHTHLIISETVKEKLKGQYQISELGEVKVKGKTIAIKIYQVQ